MKEFAFPYQIFLVIGIVVFILYRKNKKRNYEIEGRGKKRDRMINEIEDYLKKKRVKNNKI